MADCYSFSYTLGPDREPRLKASVLGRLHKLPFHHHPGLRVNYRQEGYDEFTFGGRAGPDCDFKHLAHDLAHAAEFGPDAFEERAPYGRFVFRCTQVRVLGELYDEPHTAQASQRECRTAGLQWRLMELAGCKVRPESYLKSYVSAMGFMADWYKSWDDLPREEAIRTLVLDTRESCNPSELLERIEGWLDKTHEKLQTLERKGCGLKERELQAA